MTERRLSRSLARWRVPLLLLLAALLIRLAHNQWVHQPENAIYSDMGAYVAHAKRMLSHPGGVFPDDTFFPIGTHLLLALPLALFGEHGLVVASWAYALISALIAPLCYSLTGQLIAGRAWLQRDADASDLTVARRWALGAGIVAVLYYPLISYAGYFLSEGPFALCVIAAALMSLRVVDCGRARDAWLLGIAFGTGYLIRPQILAAIALLAVLLLWRRKSFPAFHEGESQPSHGDNENHSPPHHDKRPASYRFGLAARALLPLIAAAGVMAGYAHFRAGSVRLLPSNGALNRVLARCHVVELNIPKAGMGWSPPPLRVLYKWEKTHPGRQLLLDPAGPLRLTMEAPPWEPASYHAYADRCVKQTGLRRQARYAITHVAMLWANTAWPDSARPTARLVMRWATRIHAALLLPPLLWALFAGLRRKRARIGVIAIYVWSVILTAALYFGGGRLRIPYDALMIALAACGYAKLLSFIVRKWRERSKSSEAS